MKTHCHKSTTGRRAKILLLATAAAGALGSARADITNAPEPAGDDAFFSKQFTFEFGPDGARMKESPASGGILYAKGGAATEKVPWLGVATEAVDPALAAQLGLGEKEGLTVTTTVPESPAAEAGLLNFDVLLELDGVKLDSPQTLRELVRGKAGGDVVKIALLRKGERKEIDATLVEKSRSVAAATDEPVEEPGTAPAPPKRGADPFDDDFLNDQFFQGFGGFGDFGGLGNLKEIEEHMARIREQMESRFQDLAEMDPLAGGDPGAASNFMHMENSMMSFADGDGKITIRRENGKTRVEALDADGKVVFDGPADTDEEKAKMPEDVRAKVEKFGNSGMNFNDFGLFKRRAPALPEFPMQDTVRRKSEIEKEKETDGDAETAPEAPAGDE